MQIGDFVTRQICHSKGHFFTTVPFGTVIFILSDQHVSLICRCWGFSACSWGTLMQFSPVSDQFRSFFNYIFCSVSVWSGLWTVYSTVNRVWRGGNLTHVFPSQSFCQLSAPCLQLVCECHTVSLNECCFNGRKKTLVKEKWKTDFFLFIYFFSINWNFLIQRQRSHSVHSQLM